MAQQPAANVALSKQRLDKWLWFARVVKSRTLAATLVSEGHVRVNSERCDTPSKAVRPNDVLTIALERQIKVYKIVDTGRRRGPYEEAQTLYEDLSPPPEAKPVVDAPRAPGAGRPSKRDRRLIHSFTGQDLD